MKFLAMVMMVLGSVAFANAQTSGVSATGTKGGGTAINKNGASVKTAKGGGAAATKNGAAVKTSKGSGVAASKNGVTKTPATK
jgi:hypothetical protein